VRQADGGQADAQGQRSAAGVAEALDSEQRVDGGEQEQGGQCVGAGVARFDDLRKSDGHEQSGPQSRGGVVHQRPTSKINATLSTPATTESIFAAASLSPKMSSRRRSRMK